MSHIRSILLFPGVVTILVPGLLLWVTGSLNVGWSAPKPFLYVLSSLSALFICGGLLLWIRTVLLFGTVGKGTLAPWDPPQNLVIHGIYRYVRNPMITGVFSILLGESLLLGSEWLLAWFGFFLVGNLIYIPLIEEPGLERRFGGDYITYKRHVPRWIPSIKPWKPAN